MTEDTHALAGAYALGALVNEADRVEFETHLARCEVCAEEVGGLLATSATLGRAMALPPPPSLRGRVMAQVERTPQAPPTLADHRRRKSTMRPKLAAAALVSACLAAVVGSGVVALRAEQRLDQVTAADRTVAEVLSAPDARAATGKVRGGGTITVVASRSKGRMVLSSAGLALLPSTQTYELWTMKPDSATPAGLLTPDATGHISPKTTDVPTGTTRIGLTVEPAGGSPQPTTDPILVLPL